MLHSVLTVEPSNLLMQKRGHAALFLTTNPRWYMTVALRGGMIQQLQYRLYMMKLTILRSGLDPNKYKGHRVIVDEESASITVDYDVTLQGYRLALRTDNYIATDFITKQELQVCLR